jgi:hypothetical protein
MIMSSTQIVAAGVIALLVLAVLWALPKVPPPDASADEWRHYFAERDKPDFTLTLKMLILATVGGLLLLGLGAGVVFVIVLVITGISHG